MLQPDQEPEIPEAGTKARRKKTSVSPGRPCPVCAGDHKCSIADDGLIFCGRKSGDQHGFTHHGPAQKDLQWSLYRPSRSDSELPTAPTLHRTTDEPAPDWKRATAKFARQLTAALALELAEILGLPVDVVRRLGVGYDPGHGSWTFPEKNARGDVVGIVRRDREGRKFSISGGSRGLTFGEGWDTGEGLILLVEGPSDYMTLVALGLSAVGRPSNTGGVEELADLLRGVSATRPIIVLGENDPKPDGSWPGKQGAVATAGELAIRLNRSIRYALPPERAKDVRAWLQGRSTKTDSPDQLEELGRELVAAVLQEACEVLAWERIDEIGAPRLPGFPTKVLPGWLRGFVEALAEATQTPADLAAMLVLAIVAVAVAKKAAVRIRPGYTEPLNIFAMVAQPPASRKTSVFREVAAPVEAFEREKATEARPRVAEARSRKDIKEKSLDLLKKKAARAEGADRAALGDRVRAEAEELDRMEVPQVARLLADDATPEKLVNLMANQGGRIGLFSAEGGVFEMMGGRYSGKSSPNLQAYLKAHAGDQIRVDRVGRPPDFIDQPALTMGLAVQPDVIHSLAEDPSFKARGLLGRFLYAMPRSLVGHRQVRPATLTEPVRDEYHSMVRSLLNMPTGAGEAGEASEHVIPLSPEAYELWVAFAGWLEPQLADFGALGHISDWAGKLAGAVARVAGLLHLADRADQDKPWEGPVPAGTMARALEVGRYLIPHALAAYDEMGCDPTASDARYLLEWIRRRGGGDFTRTLAFEGTKGRFKQVDVLEAALQMLARHNYLRARPAPPRGGRGRPKCSSYVVNPASLEGCRPLGTLGVPAEATPAGDAAAGVAGQRPGTPGNTDLGSSDAGASLDDPGDPGVYEEGEI